MNKSLCSVFCAVVLLGLSVLPLCASGETEKKEEKPERYEKINYTDEKRINLEIEKINKQIETQPIAAFWQSKLLSESSPSDETAKLYKKTTNVVIASFNTAISESNWITALRCFKSLEACGVANAIDSNWSVKKLEDKLTAAVNTTPVSVDAVKTKVAHMIRGTVTVWVDLGLKVQGGVGYANKMLGSGFFIDPKGYLITNHHVIANMVDPEYEGYARLYVSLADDPDERIPAKVIGWDKGLDLALLKTEVVPPYIFSLGSSADLEIGDRIYAIGSPIGLDRTITSGIVSATERKLLSTAVVMQIDAAINSGNSGGPIIDEDGSVQAVVFAGILDYNDLNFAIPVEYLKSVLPRLYAGGRLEHCWIGAYGHTLKDALSMPCGVSVEYVMPGGTAFKTGMSAGDIITAIDGEKVSTIEEFQNIMLAKMPDTIVTFACTTTDGKNKNYTVYTTPRPEYPGYTVYQSDLLENYFLPIFGMQLVMTSEGVISKKYYVKSVLPMSIADETGFSEQDKLEIGKVKLSPEKDSISTEVYAKKRRSGYIDVFISLASGLDSPYFF